MALIIEIALGIALGIVLGLYLVSLPARLRARRQARIADARITQLHAILHPPPKPRHPLDQVMGALARTPEELVQIMTDTSSKEFVGSPVQLVDVTDPRHPAHEVWAGKRKPPTVEEMRQWLAEHQVKFEPPPGV